MSLETLDVEAVRDDLGPAKVVSLYDPRSGLRAVVVIDNVAAGPSIGGIRMAPDVSAMEVFRLARAMTRKNAAAGLPHGGGKAGILADPATADREGLVRAFARAVRDLREYVPGPDMGTDETCMAWIRDEGGASVGLPREIGGIPLDEIGATGFGLARCAEVAAPAAGLELKGATAVVQGFGNVGRHAARFLEELGVRLVGACDSRGAVYDPDGIPAADLEAVKAKTGSVTGWKGGRTLPRDEAVLLPCDILVPAARPDCIHDGNVDGVQARLILSGANIPATPGAERTLWERGVVVVPDFIANAGGVICAAVEYHGGDAESAFRAIAERITRNTAEVLERSRAGGCPPREAAVAMADERVRRAMTFHR